ncbi:MAG: hypothetical protein K2G90_03030 [Muribaculaceae bacterium]|nr:hypothetical protein [Muribaculaceae bacterium]
MVKTYLMSLLLVVAVAFGVKAQVVTTTPTPLQEDSENVMIYFHADEGNKGLMGQPADAALYAHTGVYVIGADGKLKEWQYAPTWGANEEKYKLQYVSENLWMLPIGNIREYYGVAADETVSKLAFVFRNANNSKEGKDTGNADIFVDVLDSGLQLAIKPSFVAGVVPLDKEVTFTVTPTETADLKLFVNNTEIASQTGAESLVGSFVFSAVGDYTVKATATVNGKTASETLEYCVAGASPQSSLTAVPPMGAYRNSDGTVTFCIAAPEKETAIIVGSWNDYKLTSSQVMSYIEGPAAGEGTFKYFTITLPGLPKNEPLIYYYIIDRTRVGDPYARLVLDPWNDKYIGTEIYPELPAYPYDKVTDVCLAVFQDNLGEYEWKVKDFKGASKDNLVIYELLFRDFTGTEGKALGDGTVRKAIEKIPYLKWLGVNAVELLPINEFNGNISWGYNPNFYFAIDKAYGTPADYKEFIDLCHENGIAVILDVVFNQSDGQHPWYKLYSSSKNPFYNKTAPHAYSVLNDWNQGYPLVQQQWHDMLKYWLTEYKVDGFRFDLVKGLGDNDSYANNGDNATNAYNASRVARMKALHDAMREVNPDAYFINENLAGAKEENEMAADGELNWANVNEAGCQFAMGYSSGSSLNRMWATRDQRTAGSTVAYLESHDEQRLAFKQKMYGVDGVKDNREVSCYRLAGAAAQMLLVPGSHMIWQFSEMGNSQNTKNLSNGSNNTDPKVVNWAILDTAANKTLNEKYCELIRIRLANQDLFGETADYKLNFSGTSNRTASSFTDTKEIHLLANFNVTTAKTTKMPFRSTNSDDYQILSKWGAEEPVINYETGEVTVPANGYVVIANKSVESSVGSVIDDSADWGVYCNGGSLYVVNASSPVDVWNAAGMKVAHGEGNFNVSLPSGLYIVKCGGKSVKVRL